MNTTQVNWYVAHAVMFHGLRCAPNMVQTSLNTNVATAALLLSSSVLEQRISVMRVMKIFNVLPPSKKVTCPTVQLVMSPSALSNA